MSLEPGHWLTIGIFLFSNIVTVVGIIFSTRVDTNKLKDNMAALATDMSNLQKDMEKFGNILVTLADFKGEMNLMRERQMIEGKRLDRESERADRLQAQLNELTTKIAGINLNGG